MSESNRAGLRRHLVALIDAGEPGSLLPPMRRIAAEFRMSPVTVMRVVAELAAEGRVHTEPGRGTVIAARRAPRSADFGWQPAALAPARLDHAGIAALDPATATEGMTVLSSGYLAADLQPRRALQAATARTMRRASIWDTAPAAGLQDLRAVFAAQIGLTAADVIVTAGSQTAIATVLRTLAEPGDVVLVENPTYSGALAAARAAAVRPIPVPTDRDGVLPDFLDDMLQRTRARLVYLQTSLNNPTGRSLHPDRRPAVLAAAERHGAIIVDDDWARHLALDDRMPPPLIADDVDGHVVHLSSLAKPVAPSLRIGFLAAHGPALTRLHTATIAESLFINRPLQEIALELLTSPDWDRHRRHLRRALLERRDRLIAELHQQWPLPHGQHIHTPLGGHHLWIPAPTGTDPTTLTTTARQHGIVIGDGTTYWADEPTTNHIRLSYGSLTPTQITDAVRQLLAATQ